MNFDREENQTPMISGLPEQEFNMPQQTFYAPETQNSNYSNQDFESPSEQEVAPFAPPEYRQISPAVEQQPQYDEADFGEQEIANWQAQDMIIGEKGKKWFLIFFIVVAIMAGVALWLQMWSFAALIVVASLAVVVSRRESHQKVISYALSTRGVYVENNFYPYQDFKYFGILQESGIYSIVLVPKKRFSPSVSIYFPKENGEQITDIIGNRLPMEKIQHDLIDRIIRKINL